MFRVLTCLTTEHDLRMVVLAGTVCFAASFAAVCLFDRALSTARHVRAGWIAGADFRELTPKSVNKERHGAEVQSLIADFLRTHWKER